MPASPTPFPPIVAPRRAALSGVAALLRLPAKPVPSHDPLAAPCTRALRGLWSRARLDLRSATAVAVAC